MCLCVLNEHIWAYATHHRFLAFALLANSTSRPYLVFYNMTKCSSSSYAYVTLLFVLASRRAYLIQMLLFYLPRQQCLCIHHQLFVASRGHFGVICLSENVTRCIDPYTECHEGVCVCTDDAFEKNGTCGTSVGQKHVIYTENHELLRVVEVGSAQYCM